MDVVGVYETYSRPANKQSQITLKYEAVRLKIENGGQIQGCAGGRERDLTQKAATFYR